MNITTFDSGKEFISDMLSDVNVGKTQLPDFQRGWVWDDHHIRDLIASVSQSFPIGAVMTLKTGGPDVSFAPRPIEGAGESLRQKNPDVLILDGQQRLTSLFQSLRSGKAVTTRDARGRSVRRWYYLDMKKCVSDEFEREDAVVSVPEDRVTTPFRGEAIDLSTPEKEYAQDMFPLQRIFHSDEWMREYIEYWNLAPDKWGLFQKFNDQVIKGFERYQIPVITLDMETPKEAVCIVFEKVNQGGVSLTVFELLTASFAADNFNLREDWGVRERRLKNNRRVLRQMESTLFLQALALLVTKDRGGAVTCRRRDILRLQSDEYIKWADKVEDGFGKAARFLHGQKVFNYKDLPYRTQLVPLAAVMADLDETADTEGARQKLAQWFWCGVLGEMYGGATETRFAMDFTDVTRWIRGDGGTPRTVRESNFQANRLLTLRTRNSAAYKGIHALLMRDGSRDFRTGEPIEDQTFFGDSIDIHHIFPRSWCDGHGVTTRICNSIINKTAISARTNRSIGGRAPSIYLNTLQRNAEIAPSDMDGILASHRIHAPALRSDDFNAFFANRAEGILQSIESAMGKDVTREAGLFWLDAPIEDYDDGPTDWDENVD